MDKRVCDYLIIGSGMAGLIAALQLCKHGKVIIATKKKPSNSNTNWAQGGISCVVDPADSIDLHVKDTLGTGGGISDEAVVRDILADGPARIADLERYGIEFARSHPDSEDYDLGIEAGHSCRRVLHAGDITGGEVIKGLLASVAAEPNITMLDHMMAIDLVSTGWIGESGPSRCLGAYFLDPQANKVIGIQAPHTILATGGAGKVYLYTSNPDTATGDGIAMAWRVGLPIKNMEFVQFHPTCLFHPDAKSFLISEAVRGEGAKLVNAGGEAFAHRYDKRGELAPRDVVARAIDHEIKKRGDACAYLDITHQSLDFLTRRFPNIYSACLSFGIDMARDLIPVVPAAHYSCGGVEAGTNGVTAMPGLYACGEVACTGLHGANRLASNSLLEALACAHRTADFIISQGPSDITGAQIPDWQYGDAVPSDEAVVVEHNWNEVRTCMWDYVGIVRTNNRLDRASRRINNLRKEIRQYYLDYEVTPDVLELRNITAVASLIIRSAQERQESRGLHYTLDYPDTSEDFARDTRIEDPPGGYP